MVREPEKNSGDSSFPWWIFLAAMAAHGTVKNLDSFTPWQLLAIAALVGLFVLLGVLSERRKFAKQPKHRAPSRAPQPARVVTFPPPPGKAGTLERAQRRAQEMARAAGRTPRQAQGERSRHAPGRPDPFERRDGDERTGVFEVERDADGKVLSVRDRCRPWKPREFAPGARPGERVVEHVLGMQGYAFRNPKALPN